MAGRSDISKLPVFGCKVWFSILPKQNKLEPKAKEAVLVGYCGGGYRLWIPEDNTVIKSRDVHFNENVMYKDFNTEEKSNDAIKPEVSNEFKINSEIIDQSDLNNIENVTDEITEDIPDHVSDSWTR